MSEAERWDAALQSLRTAARQVATVDAEPAPGDGPDARADLLRARAAADSALELINQAVGQVQVGRALVACASSGGGATSSTEAEILRRGAAAVRDPAWRARFERAAREAEREGGA